MRFGLGILGLLIFCLPFPGLGASALPTLEDFAGSWKLNMAQSRALSNPPSLRLEDLAGLTLSIKAKEKSLCLEWDKTQSKSVIRKFTELKAEGAELRCRLEGFEVLMYLKKHSPTEMRLRDREATLVFEKVKAK